MRRDLVVVSATAFLVCLGIIVVRLLATVADEDDHQLQVQIQRSLASEPLCACEPGNPKSICVRSAYLYEGKLIMMTELPKDMLVAQEKDREVRCNATGEQAVVEGLRINFWTHSARRHLTHTFARIICSWSAAQQQDLDNLALIVQSRSNPADRCRILLGDVAHVAPSTLQPYKHRLCAVTGTLFGKGVFVDEWLDHQRVVGVEHIFAYAVLAGNESMGVPAFEPTAQFQEMVDRGEITVVPWEPWLEPKQVFYYSQHLAYNDYLYRFRGLCEWTLFADTDDFFVHFPSNHSLLVTLEEHETTHPRMNQICFCWQLFYPDCGQQPDAPLLESLLYGRQDRPVNTKSVTRTINVTDIGVHRYHNPCRYSCGLARVWHIRHGYPVREAVDGRFHPNDTYCELFRLPPSFYEQQGRRGD